MQGELAKVKYFFIGLSFYKKIIAPTGELMEAAPKGPLFPRRLAEKA